jgi:hypothetical protein
MRIVEGPTGTGPATWSRGQQATWHRANGHMAVGTPLPTQTPATGSGGEIDSGQHQAGAGPAPVGAASCRRSDPRRRRRGCQRCGTCVGWAIWLARLAVAQVPSRACRFESCPAHLLACGGTSRRPATAAVSKTEGPYGRASSILAPSAVGRRCRGGPAPGCYPGRGPGHEVRLLHLPPGSVGPAGVDARLSSGRSRVRVPYGAHCAVVAAGCQSGHSIRAARVRSPSTAHHTRPHGLAVKDARFSAGRTPVQIRLGVPMLSWRNWQTHRLQVAAPHVGSTPTESTDRPICRNR